jgi:hypothetical protein
MVGQMPQAHPPARATSLMAGPLPPNALVGNGSALFRPELPVVDKHELTPGTLLVWAPHPDDAPESPKAAQLHGGIASAQSVLHSARPQDFAHAEVTAGHVAMWIKPPGATAGPEVGEAGGQGVRTMDLKPGHWVAYKPEDAALGQAAADAMRTWTEGGQLAYSKPRAVAVLPRALAFGTGSAEELAASRAQAQRDAHSPTPSFATAGTFCSEIAAHAYQSASAVQNQPAVLDTVPSRTSPSAMHAALERSDAFTAVGIIRVEPPAEPHGDQNAPQGPRG